MKYLFHILILSFIFIINPNRIWGQKDQIHLDPRLKQRSEALLIKAGMVKADIPSKLKFGEFSTTNRQGKSSSNNKQEKTTIFYSFSLINKAGDSAYIESSRITNVASNDEGSIYISTNLDKDNLWVLLMPETPDKKEFSLSNMFLTNGDDEIEIIHVTGDQLGKTEVTAPRGIELYIDGTPIGAMQYYSGGSFSYRKYIWISNQLDDEIQLIIAGIFSAMYETAKHFEDHTITD